MKQIFIFRLCVWALCILLSQTHATSQCANTIKFPVDDIMASEFNDTVVVSNMQHAGQFFIYKAMTIGKTYVFSSSTSGDFITIRRAYDPSILLASGVAPLTYTLSGVDVVAVHINTAACGSQAINRTSTVQCTNCFVPPANSKATRALEVTGRIKISDVPTPNVAGNIRWNDSTKDFEGYDGNSWQSFTKSRLSWGNAPTDLSQENSKIVANSGAGLLNFGYSVAISGDYAIIGSPYDTIGSNHGQGSAFVFKRENNNWTQYARLVANDGSANDNFGTSVSISGDFIVIGSPNDDITTSANQGSVYVFFRSLGTWSQVQKITSSDGAASDAFGYSVAIEDNHFIVGCPTCFTDNKGAAYVFFRSGSTWTQQAKLTASDGAASDFFGSAVGLSTGRAIIGAPLDDIGANADQGSAYIFLRTGTSWAQQAKIIASDGAANDDFGWSVSLSNNYCLIGSVGDDIININQGSAYVFNRTGSTWTQQAKLTIPDGIGNDNYGSAVVITEDYAIVGASLADYDGASDRGTAYVYKRNASQWPFQTKLISSDGAISDYFGTSVALHGNTIIIGASGDNIGQKIDQGSVYFFKK